jgi:hypothetical protein
MGGGVDDEPGVGPGGAQGGGVRDVAGDEPRPGAADPFGGGTIDLQPDDLRALVRQPAADRGADEPARPGDQRRAAREAC